MYSTASPRRVRTSRRGAGLEEYRVRVIPRPTDDIATAFNMSRPTAPPLPRLANGEFKLICPPDQLDDRLARIQVHALAHLRVVTELLEFQAGND
jgi:hypothetical protein